MKNKKIHIVDASRMPKIDLMYLVFGQLVTNTYINKDIDEKHWKNYHPPICVQDIRRVNPTNLIELGLRKGILFKTI